MAYKQATRQYAQNMADAKPLITEPNRLIVKAELSDYGLDTLEAEKADNQTLSEANLTKLGGVVPIIKHRLFFDVYIDSAPSVGWEYVSLTFTDDVEVSVDEIKMTQVDQHITGTITYKPELEGKLINFSTRISETIGLPTGTLYIKIDVFLQYSKQSIITIPLKVMKRINSGN